MNKLMTAIGRYDSVKGVAVIETPPELLTNRAVE